MAGLVSGYGPIPGFVAKYNRFNSALISSPPANVAPPTLRAPIDNFDDIVDVLNTFGDPPSSPSAYKHALIHLGGLSDGLLPTPYTKTLHSLCQENRITFVNPLLSTSYLAFGYGSLKQDVAELTELLAYLESKHDITGFYLLGHSTGCQQIVKLLKAVSAANYNLKILGAMLQAPVSDRESDDSHVQYLPQAQEMIENSKGSEFLPRAAHWSPMTADRFVDLYSKGGSDDMFSSDFTDVELDERLGHLKNEFKAGTIFFCHSTRDEYVPASVDKDKLYNALEEASGCVTIKLEGNHNLATGEDNVIDELMKAVKKMISDPQF